MEARQELADIAPLKGKVEGVPMEAVSTDPAQMDGENGSFEPESTKDEPDEAIKIEEVHVQGRSGKRRRCFDLGSP